MNTNNKLNTSFKTPQINKSIKLDKINNPATAKKENLKLPEQKGDKR